MALWPHTVTVAIPATQAWQRALMGDKRRKRILIAVSNGGGVKVANSDMGVGNPGIFVIPNQNVSALDAMQFGVFVLDEIWISGFGSALTVNVTELINTGRR